MNTTNKDAEAALARLREAANRRSARKRARAAVTVSGLTLSRDDLHAVKLVQRGLHAASRAAAIRAAIHLAADVLKLRAAAEQEQGS